VVQLKWAEAARRASCNTENSSIVTGNDGNGPFAAGMSRYMTTFIAVMD